MNIEAKTKLLLIFFIFFFAVSLAVMLFNSGLYLAISIIGFCFSFLCLLLLELYLRIQHNIDRKSIEARENQKKVVSVLDKFFDLYAGQEAKSDKFRIALDKFLDLHSNQDEKLEKIIIVLDKFLDLYSAHKIDLENLDRKISAMQDNFSEVQDNLFREQLRKHTDILIDYIDNLKKTDEKS